MEMSDDSDEFNEYISPKEIADYCREYLDAAKCAEISSAKIIDGALNIAFQYLLSKEINPAEFFIQKGILIPISESPNRLN